MKQRTGLSFAGGLLPLAVLFGGCMNAPFDDLAVPALALSAPETLDFGAIPSGETVEVSFVLENIGNTSVELTRVVNLRSPTAGVDISIDAQPGTVVPGGRRVVTVRIIADVAPANERLAVLGFEVEGLAVDDPRLPQVAVLGRISLSGLVAEPNPLTIGPVLYLETAMGTVTLRNLRRRDTLVVYAMRFEAGRALYDEAVSRGEFGPLPEVEPDGRLVTLAPGESFDVTIDYTAPGGPGEAKEQAVWSVTTCPQDPEACRLSVVVQGLPDVEAPQAQVTPNSIPFGPTPVGATVQRTIVVASLGRRDLVVDDIRTTGSRDYRVQLEPATLPESEVQEGLVTYTPTSEGLHNGELRMRTNDPLLRSIVVRISGAGVVLPPCRFLAVPSTVDFGEVDVEEVLVREVSIENTGSETCVLFDPRVLLEPSTPDGTFAFDSEPLPSVRLAPNEATLFFVRFAPPSLGRFSGALQVRTSNEQTFNVPLVGGTANADVTQLSCSSNQTTVAESPVTLNAVLVGDAVAESYRWRVTSAPSAQSWRLSPSRPTGPSADLTPLALGFYEVEVQAETDDGVDPSCIMRVAVGTTGLKATLTWDGDGDLDLHLRRGNQRPWYTEDDCHFDNQTPLWVNGQGVGSGANPRLDRDDTSGEGPENIRIAVPELGIPYNLAVSHFERAAGRTARVEVSCGRASTVLDMSSVPFRGTGTGKCSQNDFWHVATLTFFALDQCTVDVVDAYKTSRQACDAP